MPIAAGIAVRTNTEDAHGGTGGSSRLMKAKRGMDEIIFLVVALNISSPVLSAPHAGPPPAVCWVQDGCRAGREMLELAASGHHCALPQSVPAALASPKEITPHNASVFVWKELNLNSQRKSMRLQHSPCKTHEPELHVPSDQTKSIFSKLR